MTIRRQYRGHLTLNTRLVVVSEVPTAVLTMLARNSDCLENEVESQIFIR